VAGGQLQALEIKGFFKIIDQPVKVIKFLVACKFKRGIIIITGNVKRLTIIPESLNFQVQRSGTITEQQQAPGFYIKSIK